MFQGDTVEDLSVLHEAAWSGEADKVRELLGSGKFPVNSKDSTGWTPLHYACGKGHLGVVRMLIEEFQADMTVQESECGSTPLMLAILSGQDSVVHALLEDYQCPVDAVNSFGETVLHYACRANNMALIRTFICKYGLDRNLKNVDGNPPIHLAAMHARGKNTVLSLVKEFGCDILSKGFRGRSLLLNACAGGNIDLVRALVGKYHVSFRGGVAVVIAGRSGKYDLVKVLIEELGCSMNNKYSATCLHRVCAGVSMSKIDHALLEQKARLMCVKTYHHCEPIPIPGQWIFGKEGKAVSAFVGGSPYWLKSDMILIHSEEYVLEINFIWSLVHDFNADISTTCQLRDVQGSTVLHIACSVGDAGLVKVLVNEFGADVNVCDGNMNTPLHVAALAGKQEVVLALFKEFGCDVNSKGFEGKSVLHCACEGGDVGLVTVLIKEYGADVNAQDESFNSPLHVAALAGQQEVVIALIVKFGCGVLSKGFKGRSVLHCVCIQGYVGLVRALMNECMADNDVRDDNMNTPLHVAALAGKQEVALALIKEFGCDIDSKGFEGRSVLHCACEGGDVGLVKTLISEYNADIRLKCSKNYTPLVLAALKGVTEVVLSLVKEDDGEELRTVMYYACIGGHSELVKALISKYRSILLEYCENEDYGPYLMAGIFGNSKVQSVLLEGGFRYVIRETRFLLHDVCRRGDVNLVRALIQELEGKFDVNVQDFYKNTPLHVAALAGKQEVGLALIKEFGCDVNIMGSEGRSVLHSACIGGDVGLVRTLIDECNADVHIKCSKNYTPLQLAALKGATEVVLSLVKEDDGEELRTVMYYACIGGHSELVRALMSKYGNSLIKYCNFEDYTPVNVAQNCVISALLAGSFTCVSDGNNKYLLHSACRRGDVNLVRALIQECKMKVNAQDDDMNTPLHVAALAGKQEVALALIKEFGCDFNSKGFEGRSVLHCACIGGDVGLVTILIKEHGANINARDKSFNFPLHVAALAGKQEVALTLIKEFGCDVNSKGFEGRSVLHCVCVKGYVGLVRALMNECKADNDVRDDYMNTPLHVAALAGKQEVALTLIEEFGCDVNSKGFEGRSVLHSACIGCDVGLVRALVNECDSDINATDDNLNTPLHVAALAGKQEVVLTLIKEFGCDINSKGFEGRSVLHCACIGGHVGLVKTLIEECNADMHLKGSENYTPLQLAALKGATEVVLSLVKEDDGEELRTVMYYACIGGHSELVKALISKHGSILVKYCNNECYTPVNVAVIAGKDGVKSILLKGGFSNVDNRFLLHIACRKGDMNLVRALIQECGVDANAPDNDMNTPLHVAALAGKQEVVLTLIKEFGCDINSKGFEGKSVLHSACIGGDVGLVRALICDIKVKLNERDHNQNLPLHVAALAGNQSVVLALLSEFACDINSKGHLGRSVLHTACAKGHAAMVEALCKFLPPLVFDDNGDTPLHTCASLAHAKCVKVLLTHKAPILIRNSTGQSPKDVAQGDIGNIFQQHMKNKKFQLDYEVIIRCARKIYSKSERITRVFVVGHPGVGKSSLIEALKREGLFDWFRKVSESAVPPHTAGIVPSIHNSKHCGRVLFYDFAGDSEYYSSHAAILENIASTKKGDNIFIVVVDLRNDKDKIKVTLNYWISFIQYQSFEQTLPYLVVIGSHSDGESKNLSVLKRFCQTSNSPLVAEAPCFMMDCRQPKSNELTALVRHIVSLTAASPNYNLSIEGSILLGVLQNDFREVTACSIRTIVSHIEDAKLQLPKDIEYLYKVLFELHEIGLLLLIKGSSKYDLQIILNVSQLTRDVHKLLFSKEGSQRLMEEVAHFPVYNTGVIPESIISNILPPYITKECLSKLQYCQQVSRSEVGVLTGSDSSNSETESFLFFPALCEVDKSDKEWVSTYGSSYSIGWMAKCVADLDYFPSRFLHVLLLRLIFRFTLSVPTDPELTPSPDHSLYQRRCSMWKTGVQWLMMEGVQCRVEVVKSSRAVVVRVESVDKQGEAHCAAIMMKLVKCVMEAKAEFCHSMKPSYYLLDSVSEAHCLDHDNRFAMEEVEAMLASQEKNVVVSVEGKKVMPCSKVLWLRKLVHWYTLFPIAFSDVLDGLGNIVSETYDLGLQLLPYNAIETVQVNHPNDVKARKREVVKEWLDSTSTLPCWWHLVQALRTIERPAIAAAIEEKHG